MQLGTGTMARARGTAGGGCTGVMCFGAEEFSCGNLQPNGVQRTHVRTVNRTQNHRQWTVWHASDQKASGEDRERDRVARARPALPDRPLPPRPPATSEHNSFGTDYTMDMYSWCVTLLPHIDSTWTCPGPCTFLRECVHSAHRSEDPAGYSCTGRIPAGSRRQ